MTYRREVQALWTAGKSELISLEIFIRRWAALHNRHGFQAYKVNSAGSIPTTWDLWVEEMLEPEPNYNHVVL